MLGKCLPEPWQAATRFDHCHMRTTQSYVCSKLSIGHATSLSCESPKTNTLCMPRNTDLSRELRLELSIVKTSPWDLRYPDLFPNPPESLESQGEPAWYFYLAEIALRRLNNRILAFTGTIGRDSTMVSDKVTAIQEFERQAHSW